MTIVKVPTGYIIITCRKCKNEFGILAEEFKSVDSMQCPHCKGWLSNRQLIEHSKREYRDVVDYSIYIQE